MNLKRMDPHRRRADTSLDLEYYLERAHNLRAVYFAGRYKAAAGCLIRIFCPGTGCEEVLNEHE